MRTWTAAADSFFFSLHPLLRLLLIAVVMALMAIIARKRRMLTRDGTAAAVLIGTVVSYIGGLSGLVMLLFFFLSAAAVSKAAGEKGEERNMMQVLANGLPAAISLILLRISPYPDACIAAFAAAIAEAEADTLSGTIGRMSHRDPVSILTLTRVPKGISGGITVLGLCAGALSSLIVALLFMGTWGCTFPRLLIVAAAGFLGSVFDSFLGASIQVRFRRKDGSITEREYEGGERNERIRGMKWIDNDAVNFLSGSFASMLASVMVLI